MLSAFHWDTTEIDVSRRGDRLRPVGSSPQTALSLVGCSFLNTFVIASFTVIIVQETESEADDKRMLNYRPLSPQNRQEIIE